MVLLARQAGLRLRADGAGPRRPTGGGSAPHGLTQREIEVLELLAEGDTNRRIGERLHISERTVGIHVSRVLAKLGVAARRWPPRTTSARSGCDDQ